MVTKICPQCGKSFDIKRDNIHKPRKYCSFTCHGLSMVGVSNTASKKTKIEKVCEFCKKTFYVHPCRKDIARFCSFSCRSKFTHPKKHIFKTCSFCGKDFEIKDGQAKRAKYCSRACSSKANIGVGENSRFWNGGQKPKICKSCGKEFLAKWNNPSKYCSFTCYTNYSVGERSHAWLGGKSFEPYPPTFNNKFKRMIRQRDNYTCAMCGEYGKDVHHINYVKNDTFPENCITLCRSCHVKTNSNRDYWANYFRKE